MRNSVYKEIKYLVFMEKIQEIEKTSGMDDLGIDFLPHDICMQIEICNFCRS